MAVWLDETPIATVPEIITVLDTETGQVVTNPNCYVSQRVAVIVLPAPHIFLTEQGLELLGPEYAGITASFRSAIS